MRCKLELVDAPDVQKLSIRYRLDDGLPRFVSVVMEKDTQALAKGLAALVEWLERWDAGT